MKVCLDVTSIGVAKERWTGVARMTWEFVKNYKYDPRLDLRFSSVGTLHAQNMVIYHLDQIGIADRFIGRPHNPLVASLLSLSTASGISGSLSGIALRGANYFFRPLDPDKIKQVDSYFSFYAGIPRQLRAEHSINCGVYVHDLIPLLLPQYCSDKQRAVLKRILKSIRPQDLVVVNSECTRHDLAAHLDRPVSDIVKVPLAADPHTFYRCNDATKLFRLRRVYGLPAKRYFLSLHNAAPHKNMPLLIKAHAAYRRSRGRSALPLVIAGGKGDPRAEIASICDFSSEELEGVTFVGFVKDPDLAALYSNAQAFFFPSLYEGFGLPVLEALFCGAPVYISDRASLPEILAPLQGYHAGSDRLLDASRTEVWTEAFLRAETVDPLDDNAIDSVKSHFSWTKTAADLMKYIISSRQRSLRPTIEE